MRAEFGYCLVCDKETAHVCSQCGTKKPNDQYTEVQLPWSNGEKMKTAVCVDCSKDAVWKADKKEMTEAHFRAWDKLGQTYDKEIVLV